jgi:hypothetical protein
VLRRDDPTLASADRWRKAVEAIRDANPRLGASLAYGRLVALRSGEVALAFPKDAAFHRGTVTGTGKAAIEKVLAGFFGRETRLSLEERSEQIATAAPSPVERDALDRAERAQRVEEAVRKHPAVQASLRILGGQIEHIEVLEPNAKGQPREE